MGEFFAKQIPGAHLEILDNCGHMLPFEKTDEFVASTVAFLKG